ncbi:MAG: hypothetical protein AMXMBFR58_03740 [Phycisphaerae bacterium]|nr:hypothetical protein [Phycisphaerales bacterium]MCK6475521.1 hypothetical protein [Phycisphaerales bacterium]
MPSQRSFSEVDEGPQDADLERFGGETRPCPSCGADVYDEVEWCHKCGHVFSQADHKVPRWVLVTAVTLVAGFVVYLIAG